MRFKQFIIEQIQPNEAEPEGDFTIKDLSDEEWADWVVRHCSDYLPRAGNHPIYRGFKNIEIINLGVKDTNEFTRRSGWNIPNYYTLWMDNAAQWKDYPRRSKSFIGTSNFRLAQRYRYRTVYQLFPANDAKIGISPKDDIWHSFGEVPGFDLGKFAHLLKKAFKKIYGDAVAERAEVDWTEFRRLLELTDFKKFLEVNKLDIKYGYSAQKSYPKLIDYFRKRIIPKRYGFQYTTSANYSLTGTDEREVWVQGKVALLKVNSIFNLKNGHRLFPRTLALLSKHNIKKPN